METKTLCKYFLHGVCSRGESCLFAHDLDAKPDNICKFFQTGSCMYGKTCRYDHVKQPKVIKPVIDRNTEVTSPTRLIPLGKNPKKDEPKEVKWSDAPVFVPGQKAHKTTLTSKEEDCSTGGLYSEIASSNIVGEVEVLEEYDEGGLSFDGNSNELLCPFAAVRDCPYGDSCEYLHGDLCDMCGCQCLHPTDEEQRKEHQRECMAHHEHEMEIAFAAQRSSGVSCSICLDVVKDKANISERIFGILENCNHPFCLNCIRKWRSSSSIEKTVIRACPLCRVTSWFVTPSDYWMEDEEDKTKLINSYKEHLNTKHCRNFDRGRGSCQFGDSCFYKHVLADGTKDESKPDLRHKEDSEGQSTVLKTPRLNEFIAARDT